MVLGSQILFSLESRSSQVRPPLNTIHLLPTDSDSIIADVSKLAAAEKALHQSHVERSHLMASEGAAKEASRLKCVPFPASRYRGTDASAGRTEFVTNISHEIRTPIATVIGICELLLDDLTLMDSHRALVEKSLRSGEILLDLVGMVLVSTPHFQSSTSCTDFANHRTMGRSRLASYRSRTLPSTSTRPSRTQNSSPSPLARKEFDSSSRQREYLTLERSWEIV